MQTVQNKRTLAAVALGLLMGRAPLAADPITAITGYFHGAMTTAGSDLTAPLIIIGALAGMMKGFMGVIAGGVLGLVVAIIIANADVIRLWAHQVSLL